MKKSAVMLTCGLLAAVCLGVLFYLSHPTHYSFCDRFVIGRSMQDIKDRYGEPYRETPNRMTYLIRDDSPEWVMGYDDSLWYVIELEQGVAVNVYLRKGDIGG